MRLPAAAVQAVDVSRVLEMRLPQRLAKRVFVLRHGHQVQVVRHEAVRHDGRLHPRECRDNIVADATRIRESSPTQMPS